MITVIFKSVPRQPGIPSRDESPNYLPQHLFRFYNQPHSWRPPTDIYETEYQVIILVEIAGMEESGISVNIDQNILTVSGVRNAPIIERRAFHQMEIPFGDFISQIELPTSIDIEKIEANYNNGFLCINLPKEKPKRIEIKEE
jgi:HSP20 family protein